MKGDYNKSLKHREKLLSKKQRLDGLRDLYATYEQAGKLPIPGSYMWDLRAKIHAVENQLRVMANAEDVYSWSN
jgi:hypothetical protein